jgi:hypothetical protein
LAANLEAHLSEEVVGVAGDEAGGAADERTESAIEGVHPEHGEREPGRGHVDESEEGHGRGRVGLAPKVGDGDEEGAVQDPRAEERVQNLQGGNGVSRIRGATGIILTVAYLDRAADQDECPGCKKAELGSVSNRDGPATRPGPQSPTSPAGRLTVARSPALEVSLFQIDRVAIKQESVEQEPDP